MNDVIERLRRELAPWEPVDRAAQFGDLLNLNVRGTIDDEKVVEDQGIDYVPQQENVLPFPGFAVNLEGTTEGQEKDFAITIAEDYPRPQFAGKECSFHVDILSIKEKRLADLDDEFAKGVGEGFDTFQALIDSVRDRLTADSEAEANRELETNSLEEVVNLATIEASDMLFERELENIQQERERMLRGQRLDMDTYLSYIGKTEEEFQESCAPLLKTGLPDTWCCGSWPRKKGWKLRRKR